MRRMIRKSPSALYITAFVLFFLFPFVSRADKSPQHAYIEKYSRTAVAEMYRSGVPASITLAQGMLESSNGQSELAVKGNNHFGIKCHDWNGARMYYDDDRKGECFRKYRSAEDSYRDHSDFLRFRDRYKFLFDLETTDYKGWAYGLKRAGYATDPAYPRKLIKIIEDYGLDRYDTMDRSYATSGKDRASRRVRGRRGASSIPESPSVLEQAQVVGREKAGSFSMPLSRQLYSMNGVLFVYSNEGETYGSIAKANGLFLREILSFNDLPEDRELLPGTTVYLQRKKSQAARDIRMHVAEDGDSLREISQRYGVRLKSVLKMNGMTEDTVLKEGDVVKLRRK